MQKLIHRWLIVVAALALLTESHARAQSAMTPRDAPRPAERHDFSEANPAPLPWMSKPDLPTFARKEAGGNRRVPLNAFWDDGLRLESSNEQFHLHFGGTLQIDSTWFIGPGSVFELPDGRLNGVGNSAATFLRRARLRADGDVYGLFDFVIEYDFANATNENSGDDPPSFGNLTSSPSPANVWMQIRDVPVVGYVRIGYQTKPIGMANNTSQGNLPFLERPDVNDGIYAPFDGGYALGISAHDWIESERIAWRYGVYRPLTNVFGIALNKYAFGARVTALPRYEDDGQSLIHLGLGSFGGEVVEDKLRLRARPLLRNGPGFGVPVLVDTGQIPGTRQYAIGPEFALVQGPLTIQAEWAGQFLTNAEVNGQSQGTVFYHGGYVEALWFLTGEVRAYNKRDGVFGRVVPHNNYHYHKGDGFSGFGAWQIGARFSYLNLNDKAVRGGEVYDWTAGVNWYLNANMKFQLDYILEHREGPTGTPVGWFSGVGLRGVFEF